jgi:predicted dehydrogenase
MVEIGVVGIGFMGMTHFRGARGVRGGKVTAICTRDEKKLKGDWRDITGNFGDPGGKEDLSGVRPYRKLEELLADPKIDMVDICLPSALHRDTVVKALRAGKNVLVEKPIALTVRDADLMVREAEKAGRSLLVAQVLPFFPEFKYLSTVVRNGKYGKLLGGHFKRIISMPDWSSAFSNLAQSGDPGIDLHIHDTHYMLMLCGLPEKVFSTGRMIQGKCVEYLCTTYLYEDRPDLALTCASGVICKPGRPFTHGFEVYLEKATITYETPGLLTVLTADGKVKTPKLSGGDPVEAFTEEIQEAVDQVRKGKISEALSGERAADALRLCYKEIESVQRGRQVRVK